MLGHYCIVCGDDGRIDTRKGTAIMLYHCERCLAFHCRQCWRVCRLLAVGITSKTLDAIAQG